MKSLPRSRIVNLWATCDIYLSQVKDIIKKYISAKLVLVNLKVKIVLLFSKFKVSNPSWYVEKPSSNISLTNCFWTLSKSEIFWSLMLLSHGGQVCSKIPRQKNHFRNSRSEAPNLMQKLHSCVCFSNKTVAVFIPRDLVCDYCSQNLDFVHNLNVLWLLLCN